MNIRHCRQCNHAVELKDGLAKDHEDWRKSGAPCKGSGKPPKRLPKRRSVEAPARFEQQVGIVLVCCQVIMKLEGNLSLREGGGPNTTLGYACESCFRRVAVVDEWLPAGPVED